VAVSDLTTALPTRVQPYLDGPVLVEGLAQVTGNGTGGLATLEVHLEASPTTIYVLESIGLEGDPGSVVLLQATNQYVIVPTSSFLSKGVRVSMEAGGSPIPNELDSATNILRLVKSHPGIPSLALTLLQGNFNGTAYSLGVTAWKYDLKIATPGKSLVTTLLRHS